MGLDAKTNFVGIVTATGEVTSERGALRIADNVTLRKAGALTLRQSFASTGLSRSYKAAFPYKGLLYYVDQSGGYWRADTDPLYFGQTVTQLRADIQSMKEARGNLYFPSLEGVWKVTSASETTLRRSGLWPTAAVVNNISLSAYNGGGAGELLTTGQQVSYRIVMVLTDPNGVIIRGRPSGAVTVQATGTQSPYVSVLSAYPVPAGWKGQIEVYRSRVYPAGVQIDDELQLVKTYELPINTSFSGGAADIVPDIRRGQTIYTAPSRGGIESANDRPPGCACVERYRTSLFFGNILGPQRFVFSYNPSTSNLAGTANGVGVRMVTGTTTSGSANITAVSNTTGLQVGMYVFAWTAGSMGQITFVSGSTFTTSLPAAASAAGQNIYAYDSVLVDGSAVPLGVGVSSAGLGGLALYPTTSGALVNTGSSVGNAYTMYELTPPAAGYTQTVVIERLARGGSTFQVRATHGGEMSPQLPLANAGGSGALSSNDALPHGLMWSDPDEPEHVPPRNLARVGDAGKAILALVATRDRLLIMKEDGVFMLTGDVAANFAIYPLDTTCLCILPGSVRRLQNTVYFLSNLGLVAVDENGGVAVVSRAIQTEIAPIVTQIRQAQKASGLYQMPGLSGITGTSDDPNGEYWLALGTTAPSFGGHVLVWNAFQGGFTTYSFGAATPVALAHDGEGQPLVIAASSMLTPTTTLGAIVARISPRAFSDPALVGKMWTHIVAGFSRLTGTTSITARFSSSESMVDGTTIDEVLEAPTSAGLVQLPAGSLLRHPMPRAMARAFLSFVELVVAVSNGTFTLELLGSETRENIPNKRPSHGTGAL